MSSSEGSDEIYCFYQGYRSDGVAQTPVPRRWQETSRTVSLPGNRKPDQKGMTIYGKEKRIVGLQKVREQKR